MSLTLKLYQFLWNKKWIHPRNARTLYKRLSRAGAAPDFPFTKDFFGINYEGNLNNNIDFNIYYYGAFEKPLLYFLRDTMNALAPAQSVFIDIGANVGQHSLFMSTCTNSVHSFEPFVKVRERLELQIANNSLRNIQVHAIGISDANTTLPFFAPTGNNKGIGSFDANSASKGNVSIGELELVKGDDFFPAHGINKIDIMKIDVEGFEKPALKGLCETLKSTLPIIVCEVTYGESMSFTSIDELLAHLPQDYALYTFDKRKLDGSKARRRDAKARTSGEYSLIPYTRVLDAGQDDIIACPIEKRFAIGRQDK